MSSRIWNSRGLSAVAVAIGAIALTVSQVVAVQASKPTISVGVRGFTEDQIAGYMYADLLDAHGFKVNLNEGFGSESSIFSALTSGSIDIDADYLGNGLVDNSEVYKPGTSAKAVWKHINSIFKPKYSVELFTPAYKFNDQNVFVTTKKVSKRFSPNLTTLSELAKDAPKIKLEVMYECTERSDCLLGFNQVYHPKKFKQVADPSSSTNNDNPPFYDDLRDGKFDVVQGYGSTDAQIAHFHLIALKDNKKLFPPDQLVPFVRVPVANANPNLAKWLNKLSADLTTAKFAALNAYVAFGGKLPQTVAHNFLTKEKLI